MVKLNPSIHFICRVTDYYQVGKTVRILLKIKLSAKLKVIVYFLILDVHHLFKRLVVKIYERSELPLTWIIRIFLFVKLSGWHYWNSFAYYLVSFWRQLLRWVVDPKSLSVCYYYGLTILLSKWFNKGLACSFIQFLKYFRMLFFNSVHICLIFG